MKGISAVVATYRRRDELGRLFDSIISNGLEQIEVIGVDFGNQQRHQRIHAMVAGVAEDDVSGPSKGFFGLTGD